ncbi:hypothetical protein ASPWEDRAFT_56799 [Aspergillus wentii DTO 134E9]|uniref:PHD finger domain protein n=1 Tax=Aspergillus wentii DTO 134E9 TaxID=1073089 RepID=A0A1L9S3Q3_ASPWE|nr:uncharacterized protein ASPWEDRAFT_56799 [Aspergillus wentii DTO 134E9]KAI9930121.1 nuA3 HAT complex component nto1 [Aspergillus wentii]OJJ41784.1 hypothetical protein ASPWEDRAFT_56799 [Aspergillus wentii DTO 134E9]
MAPLSTSKFRAPPGRPAKNRPKISLKASDTEVSSEGPPPKKRKYVPGGPGGGGRYIDIYGKETTPAPKPSPIRRSSSGSRSRPRESKSQSVQEPVQPVNPAEPVDAVESPAQQSIKPPIQLPPPPPPVPATPPSARLRREKSQNRGRYTSSTAAALALQQGDGYKPREERGWEEFHPDLDIEAKFTVFSSEEVDGPRPPVTPANAEPITSEKDTLAEIMRLQNEAPSPTPVKRRPGRPPRRPEAILAALRAQHDPKPVPVPPPGPNPRERLTLPKPSFRIRDPFTFYDQPGVGQQNYVDRTMASVGYQESDVFLRHDRQMVRMAEAQEDDLDTMHSVATDGEVNAAVGRVEYDMDEQDEKWLEDYNTKRREDQLEPIKPAVFEITMTKIEKEWHALEKRIPKPNPKPPQTQRPRSSSAAAVNGEITGPGEEQDTKCAICDDGDCENSNAIVFCDGCDLAVHQECYGVPFIPEGQWLCRKCQLIGRGSVNCIFCPNTEGAFKQTTTSKWSHLLCAIWIPEVSIGNPSLMEPITDIEKVPKSRWKLHCYICRQRMGSSIQCSNKNCFVAFHVTCARRAQLYLKMKSGHGTPAIMDSHLLKAFCDKHVPPEWRREHGTDAATADAIEYYRTTMQGRQWGDSQATALSLEPSHPLGCDHGDDFGQRMHTPRITLTVGGNKRKRIAVPKTIWKLPSGAPVIPQVLLNSVAASLQRFTVRQRKQYAEDACKYWTLKREARRGAALLKRLQLQLETFSSMEMTRRDYVAMGIAGGKRLQRRIEFGERLHQDLENLRMLCDQVRNREREKLKDAEMLRNVVDTVYFPIFPLLWPILEKAQGLDGKRIFREGLMSIRSKVEQRFYTSVAAFSADLAGVFTSEIGVQPAGDTAELQMQISGRAPELSLEQREKRKLAKRIIKAIQPGLEDAIRKESELNRKPFEKELKELDNLLEHNVLFRRDSFVDSAGPAGEDSPEKTDLPNGTEEKVDGDEEPAKSELREGAHVNTLPDQTGDTVMPDADAETTHPPEPAGESQKQDVPTTEAPAPEAPMTETAAEAPAQEPQEPENPSADVPSATVESTGEIQPAATEETKNDSDTPDVSGEQAVAQKGPPTPPLSFQGDQQLPLSQGGVQWYMQPFDPVGTTIHEERWTGRDVMRGMSEELSELDEEELKDLVDDEVEGTTTNGTTTAAPDAPAAEEDGVKVHRTRRRWRGFK